MVVPIISVGSAATPAAALAASRPAGPASALPLILALPGKTVSANVTKCRFHWIRLAGRCLPVTVFSRFIPLPPPSIDPSCLTLCPT